MHVFTYLYIYVYICIHIGVIGEKTKKTAGKKMSFSPAGEGSGPAI
jgi:hypothetical protein